MASSPRRAALLAAVAALSTAACTVNEPYKRAMKENETLSQAVDDLRRQNEQLLQENTRLKETAKLRDVHIETLDKQANVAGKLKDLEALIEQQAAEARQKGEVEGPEKIAPGHYRFKADYLFRPGQEDVAKEARERVRKFAETLRGDSVFVQIVGHTDNDPIRASARENPTLMNLELGARRATYVAHEFKKAGVEETHIQTVSMGDACPVADNATAEGRAKNRRVDILLAETPPPGYGPQPHRKSAADEKPKKKVEKEEPTK